MTKEELRRAMVFDLNPDEEKMNADIIKWFKQTCCKGCPLKKEHDVDRCNSCQESTITYIRTGEIVDRRK